MVRGLYFNILYAATWKKILSRSDNKWYILRIEKFSNSSFIQWKPNNLCSSVNGHLGVLVSWELCLRSHWSRHLSIPSHVVLVLRHKFVFSSFLRGCVTPDTRCSSGSEQKCRLWINQQEATLRWTQSESGSWHNTTDRTRIWLKCKKKIKKKNVISSSKYCCP